MEEKETWWRMAELWPRLPPRVQEIFIDLAEILADELEKAKSPNRADTREG